MENCNLRQLQKTARQTSHRVFLMKLSDNGHIPHICHFFYTGRIFKSQYSTPINYKKHPKITTYIPKKCKICIFLRSIWKILHWTEFVYTGTACGACDKYEVWPQHCFVAKQLNITLFCHKTLKYGTFCRETLKYGTF